MKSSKRLLLQASLAAAVMAAFAPLASHAQQWPAKQPIKLVVPYAAGGFADLRARQLATKLSKSLGANVIVENKPGAGGVVGTDFVAKSAPDGYTLGMGNLAPLAVNPTLMKQMPYNAAKDLQPVVLIEKAPLFLMTNPSSGIASVADLIAKAKANPGKYGFASSGIGGAHHLSGEMLNMLAGVQLTHVPYKGGAPATTDLFAGHVPLMFEMGYSALPNLRTGKVKALAVSSTRRLAVAPDVMTMQEAGLKNFASYNWQGVVAPAGTPSDIVNRLNKEINAALAAPDMRASIEETGAEVGGGSPEDFAKFIRSETDTWAKVIKSAKIEAQ
ncbi:Tripartite-type tricarboxylate transporter, receptor component TctC [Noviherbaspirillum humi]|uniref:Tripartite-type tricarboxylate transporter, receptor component TctC n=1 Tax=Noviherbaspirillum humi TaxID=1688639 RepID=A0A239LY83_9BURK|nr:tripartite tricarboxylate transporter substrate binding protein [Noviherbaspirillum humi]SNT35315.1 Tripartite-type tricarboxylate transporter, receptor component TctC [Noviherbaspirillum humi]